jgi:hypothetical protein
MAPLPEARVTPGEPPFSSVSIDYFGPLKVKYKRGTVKRYGCVFTCLAIRAIHIEIAHDLSTDSFIQAVSSFVSRRGPPKELFSDNGTNPPKLSRCYRIGIKQRSWIASGSKVFNGISLHHTQVIPAGYGSE